MIDFSKSKKKLTALGLNIGGGAFTLGASNYFKILGQWEDQGIIGAKSFDLNFEGIYRPLRYEQWKADDLAGKVNYIYANPACRPWSSASVYLGRRKPHMFQDKRLVMTEHVIETGLKIKPDVLISESVEAAFDIGVNYYNEYAKIFNKHGYHVTYFLNDAVLQGTPCVRRRFHFIAHRYALTISEKPTIKKIVPVKDAIGDLIDLNNRTVTQHDRFTTRAGFEPYMPLVPIYGGLKNTINKIPDYKWNQCSFLIKKLSWDHPACTIVGFEYIHPIKNRWLSYREVMRLCGYPDWYIAHNAVDAVDAVLPPVADFLSYHMKKTIENEKPVKPGVSVIDWRPYGKPFHFQKSK